MWPRTMSLTEYWSLKANHVLDTTFHSRQLYTDFFLFIKNYFHAFIYLFVFWNRCSCNNSFKQFCSLRTDIFQNTNRNINISLLSTEDSDSQSTLTGTYVPLKGIVKFLNRMFQVNFVYLNLLISICQIYKRN